MIDEGGYKDEEPIKFDDGKYFGEGDDDDNDNDGKRSGEGVMEYYDGNVYIGNWKDDMRSGMGILKYKKPENQVNDGIDLDDDDYEITRTSPNIYIGEFENDMMNGFGKLKYNNEFTYVGYWKDGKRHGTGLYYNKMIHYYGDWKDDVFVEGEKIIFGTKTNTDGQFSITDYYIEEIRGKSTNNTNWSELRFSSWDKQFTDKKRTYKLKKELKKELL